jgi:SOS regulatory protein LexA
MDRTPAGFEKLRRFYVQEKRMPSYGELAALLEFRSKNAAQYVVRKWVGQGLLEKGSAGKLIPGKLFGGVRVLGAVTAGWPSPAEEETADTISLDEWLIENREASFMLRISGDSMIDAGIRPGDMVIVERGRAPKNGDIVVAEVDREWTIKTYEKLGGQIRLVPANAAYQPIVPQEELRFAGVVRAVIRKY